MAWTMDRGYRDAMDASIVCGGVSLFLFILLPGSDFISDGIIDHPVQLYTLGSLSVLGLIGALGSYALGQRAARKEMVSIHGEEEVHAYERTR